MRRVLYILGGLSDLVIAPTPTLQSPRFLPENVEHYRAPFYRESLLFIMYFPSKVQ